MDRRDEREILACFGEGLAVHRDHVPRIVLHVGELDENSGPRRTGRSGVSRPLEQGDGAPDVTRDVMGRGCKEEASPRVHGLVGRRQPE